MKQEMRANKADTDQKIEGIKQEIGGIKIDLAVLKANQENFQKQLEMQQKTLTNNLQ